MPASISIGNAQGFWGDSPLAPARLLETYPELDFLTLDYLAEVSMSILAAQRAKDPQLGYARDFLDVVESLVPFWKQGSRVRVVCNAGGLNPAACAQAVVEKLRYFGIEGKRVAMVRGDDVLPNMLDDPSRASFAHLETGDPATNFVERFSTANAYVGADSLVEALDAEADIVVTGRVADPSLAVACCRHAFGWRATDFDKLAAATIAGHILECGAQACGGISTDWLAMDDPADIGFPVAIVDESAAVTVTKGEGTGGAVTRETVTEQLLYELGDPKAYLSPDCVVDFTAIQLAESGRDRIVVDGFHGAPPPDTYKVSATYRDGYKAIGSLTIFGANVVQKAERSAHAILDRLARRGDRFERSVVECVGADAVAKGILPAPKNLREVVMRMGVADADKAKIGRFSRELVSLVTGGAQGTTGYAAGRPPVQPVFAYWPCLIARGDVEMQMAVWDS